MRDAKDDTTWYKARLVAYGNFQLKFEGYFKLYAPVACIELIRLVLAIATVHGFTVNQLGVKGAFFHTVLPANERILVMLPKIDGIPSANGRIVRLKKSFYGL